MYDDEVDEDKIREKIDNFGLPLDPNPSDDMLDSHIDMNENGQDQSNESLHLFLEDSTDESYVHFESASDSGIHDSLDAMDMSTSAPALDWIIRFKNLQNRYGF